MVSPVFMDTSSGVTVIFSTAAGLGPFVQPNTARAPSDASAIPDILFMSVGFRKQE